MKFINFRRLLRWSLFALAALVTITVLAYSALSYFGRREWSKVQAELRAKGEKLSLVELAPAKIPDDKNFFATPIWQEVLELEPGTERDGTAIFKEKIRYEDGRIGAFKKALPVFENKSVLSIAKRSLERGQRADLGPVAAVYTHAKLAPSGLSAPQTILVGLDSAKTELQELEQAASRPGADPNRNVDGNFFRTPIPHIPPSLSIAQYLAMRIAAEAADGQGTKAGRDLFLMLRLGDALKSDPLLISLLVRLAILNIAVQSVWDGLDAGCWDDPQLAEIQGRLSKVEIAPDFANSLRAERGGANQALESYARGGMAQMIKDTDLLTDFSEKSIDGEKVLILLFASIYPSGLLFQSLAIYNRLIQDMIDDLGSDPFRLTFGEDVQRQIAHLEKPSTRVFYPLVAIAAPSLTSPLIRVVNMETRLRQAQIAIALQRYRLTHQKYPEALQDLVPTFLQKLPSDPCSNFQFRYRLTAPDHFILWSVGANQTDENGKNPSSPNKLKEADWVWQSATQ